MSSTNNISVNVKNAVTILRETYSNLTELFNEMDRVAEEEGFVSMTPKFLRWRSDANYNGWLTSSFIKVYQYDDGASLPLEGLQEGPVYAVEVNLDDWEAGAMICLLKYEFDLSQWSRLPGVSEHWIFYHPLYEEKHFNHDYQNEIWSITINDDVKEKYWGFQQGKAKELLLHTINTTEDVRTNIFEALLKL